jgi:hypothetical protein
MPLHRPQTLLAALALTAGPTLAKPVPPTAAPGIVIETYGVHCNIESAGTLAAPNTESGVVDLMSGTPEFTRRQQDLPARIGISFAVVAISDRDIFDVRMTTWKPGATRPEYWVSDMVAGEQSIQGFMFETPSELITGLWRLEAYDGDTLLYSVEFDVLPGDQLPGVTSDCNFVS